MRKKRISIYDASTFSHIDCSLLDTKTSSNSNHKGAITKPVAKLVLSSGCILYRLEFYRK
jgi:hypothetical protein